MSANLKVDAVDVSVARIDSPHPGPSVPYMVMKEGLERRQLTVMNVFVL